MAEKFLKNSEGMFQREFFAPFAGKLKGKKIYCSFSGGGDSFALLLFLYYWRQVGQYTLSVLHFEHGFRGAESWKDAEFCRKKCEEKNILFQCIPLSVPEHKKAGEGDEEAARRLRLEAWEKIIIDPENEYIATGHHAGDERENLFLRLFRGGNTSSLTSMRTFSHVGKLTFFRPFLHIEKSLLEEFLRQNNEHFWCTDSTNKEDFYNRNFLRNTLLPAIFERFPFAEKGILASVRSLECDAAFIEETAQKTFQDFRINGYKLENLYPLHDALLIRVLRYFFREKGFGHIVPDSPMLERVKEALKMCEKRKEEKNGENILLPVAGGEKELYLSFSPFKELQIVEKEKKKSFAEKKVLCDENSFSEGKNIEIREEDFSVKAEFLHEGEFLKEKAANVFYFDGEELILPLSLTLWQGGEKMIPFGRATPVLLKKLFSDAKISAFDRKKYPLLLDGKNQILCIGKLRRSALAPVTEKTKKILKILFH